MAMLLIYMIIYMIIYIYRSLLTNPTHCFTAQKNTHTPYRNACYQILKYHNSNNIFKLLLIALNGYFFKLFFPEKTDILHGNPQVSIV